MGKVHRYATMRKYLVLLCLLIFCNTESDSFPIVEVQSEDENFSPATTIQRYELFRKSGLALVEDKKNGSHPYCVFYNSFGDRKYPDFRAVECHSSIADGLNAVKFFEYLDKKFLEKLNSTKPIEYEQQLKRSDGKFCIFYKGQRKTCYENMDDAEESIDFIHEVERYSQGWENNLITFPELTEEEFIKSKNFQHEFYFEDLKVNVRNETHDCIRKTTGTVIAAYSNELHPLGVYVDKLDEEIEIRGFTNRFGSNKHYLLSVDYNCWIEDTGGGFMLFGPVFYQNNQWWGFEYYDDDYYDASGNQNVYAFMSYFVKRVSLGENILPKK